MNNEMVIKKTLLTIISILFIHSWLFAQALSDRSDSVFEEKLLYEVKQLDQFIGRFNLSENIYGSKYPSELKDSLKMHQASYSSVRKKILLSLFDFDNIKSDTSVLKGFINEVVENSRIINFNDKNWFAVVNTTILFNGSEKNSRIILQIEKNAKDELKWVIRGVKADFLEISSKETNDFINPMSHETYFIDLRKVFENKNHVKQYAYDEFKQDNLSIFLYLVSQNKIHLKRINSINYHFLQIDNYIFTIDFFNRSAYNSGWLISNLISATESQKEQYLENVLYISK
jgi:hypothetical protein